MREAIQTPRLTAINLNYSTSDLDSSSSRLSRSLDTQRSEARERLQRSQITFLGFCAAHPQCACTSRLQTGSYLICVLSPGRVDAKPEAMPNQRFEFVSLIFLFDLFTVKANEPHQHTNGARIFGVPVFTPLLGLARLRPDD